MKKKTFKYDAFISYRHTDLDKYVAENLHRLIETYQLPKPVMEKYHIQDNQRRLFRDQEELPLSPNLEDPIYEALKESRFLIIICSPRLKESIWCKKEIETYIKLYGKRSILCVLVEGEPKDSFPEEVFYDEKIVETKKGKKEIQRVACEPLAMDVRGNSKKEVYKKIKEEIVRIIAPMYNLDYEDIKRRNEERKLQKKIKTFKIISLAATIFAIYSAILFINIFLSSEKLKYDQAMTLAEQSSELRENDDREGAIEKAYQSLTSYHKNKMPTTAKGIYELTESLGVYYPTNQYHSLFQLNTTGVVEDIQVNLEKTHLLSLDNSQKLILWNLENRQKIEEIEDINLSNWKNKYTFIEKKGYAYQNKNEEIIIKNLKGKEINKITDSQNIMKITTSDSGKYLVILSKNKIVIYDTDIYQEKFVIERYDTELTENILFDEKEEYLIYTSKKNNEIELSTYQLSNNQMIASKMIRANLIKKMIIDKDNLIFLSSRKDNFTTTMIITNYNYQNGTILFQKEYEKTSPSDVAINNSSILASAFGTSYLLDYNTGEEKAAFSIESKVINSFGIVGKEEYYVFTTGGNVHVIYSDNNGLNNVDNNIIYTGLFNFNGSYYEQYKNSKVGIVTYQNNSNRIIIYSQITNPDKKEISYKKIEEESLKSKEKEQIIKEYQLEKENLISNIVYSKDKENIYVSYITNKLDIYNTKNKKKIKTIEGINYIERYVGKTKKQEHLIIGNKDGYLLNKNYEIIARIPKLYDYKDGKIILKESDTYYEIKLYTLKELKERGKFYANSVH